MELKCPKCGAVCVGEDLGDHENFLTYDCECGYSWSDWR